MKGSRPEQAALAEGPDLSHTEETRAVVSAMVDGLDDRDIEGLAASSRPASAGWATPGASPTTR